MATDRFVIWKGKSRKKRPTRMDLHNILEDYLSDAAEQLEWDTKTRRFVIQLVGKPSFPFRRLEPDMKLPLPDSRWIEIFVDADGVDVITRQADEFTCHVAQGIVRMLKRYYGADVDAEFLRD